VILLHAKTLAADLARGAREAEVYQWVQDPETWLGDEGASRLAGDPHAASLRSLTIARHRIGPLGVRAIASSPHLAHLKELRLDGNPLRDEGALELARSPHLRLRVLGLGRSGVLADGLRALLASPVAHGLEELDLSGNLVPWVAGGFNLGAEGARVIAEADLPRLRSLRLAEHYMRAEGAAILAASPLLEKLRELDVSNNSLGEEGLRALAASPHLRPGLRLRTGQNNVEGGDWCEYRDGPIVVSEGWEDVSARPHELAKKGIVFPPGVEIH
jgi:Leucine Rich Repeat (LRR) protein